MLVKNNTDHKIAIYVGKIGGVKQRKIVRPGESVDVEDISSIERYYTGALIAGLTPVKEKKETKQKPVKKKQSKSKKW